MHAKARNVPEQHAGEFGYGDVCTWMATDPKTKLIPTLLVATRDEFAAHQFIRDLGSRPANRVQITTDGSRRYLAAIEAEFGQKVDCAQMVKTYGREGSGPRSVTGAKLMHYPLLRRQTPTVRTS